MILFSAMGWPTIVALIVVVLIVGALVAKLIVDKVKGKSSCSCGCSGCAMREMCHSKGKTDKEKSPKSGQDGENQSQE